MFGTTIPPGPFTVNLTPAGGRRELGPRTAPTSPTDPLSTVTVSLCLADNPPSNTISNPCAQSAHRLVKMSRAFLGGIAAGFFKAGLYELEGLLFTSLAILIQTELTANTLKLLKIPISS